MKMKMLSKLSKNKVLVGLLLAVLLIAAVGGTYAWFISRVESELLVDMGNLKVETTLTEDEYNPIVVEPGMSYEYYGVVTNRGSIPAAVLVDYSDPVQVTIKSDSDGNPLANYYTISADPALISVVFDEDTLGWGANSDFTEMYQWFSVDGETGKYLLLIYGKDVSTAEVKYTVELDGSGMGNEYQNAALNISGSWTTSQLLEAAILDNFGLVMFGPDANVTPVNVDNFQPFSLGPTQEQVLAQFEELMNR